ncbi:hypothetical protein BN1013_01174 [Candidatus Rubidus massiliensis]|nr:hypothetical protein BN1013_01174 [Candidatus Rubidus massiliensis]
MIKNTHNFSDGFFYNLPPGDPVPFACLVHVVIGNELNHRELF